MLSKTPLTLVLVLALGGCGWIGGSRLNPMNWFSSKSEETLAPADGWQTTSDRRVLVPDVTEAELLRVPEGAILRAAGIMPTQGAWDVELRPVNNERPVGDALIYEFVAANPRANTTVGAEAARLVTAGVKISSARLDNVRRVVVRGARNAREFRR